MSTRSQEISVEQIYSTIEEAFQAGEYDPVIRFSSSEKMKDVEDNSVQLIVTSPPYNVGIEYGVYDDSKSQEGYLSYLDTIWAECKRVLCKGGRLAVNVANADRKPYNFIFADIGTRLKVKHGFLMRGDVIWDKGASVGVSTAWGSWRSASNPVLRDVHEHIQIFCKDDWKLHSPKRITSISSKDFCTYTRSVWNMRTETGISNAHPTPFPIELPRRLIQLYTYVGDTVLDPFLGSGTTCIAAKSLARKSIGYEIDTSYRSIVESRLKQVESLTFELQDIKLNGKNLEQRFGSVF